MSNHEHCDHYHPEVKLKAEKPGLKQAAIIFSAALRFAICPGDDIALLVSQVSQAWENTHNHSEDFNAVIPRSEFFLIEEKRKGIDPPRRKKGIVVNPKAKIAPIS